MPARSSTACSIEHRWSRGQEAADVEPVGDAYSTPAEALAGSAIRIAVAVATMRSWAERIPNLLLVARACPEPSPDSLRPGRQPTVKPTSKHVGRRGQATLIARSLS